MNLSGEVLSPRLLGARGRSVRVALVPTGALLLGGDAVEIDVAVGEGCLLEIVETAGTVAYPGPPATWRVRVRIAEGGTLVWAGLPFVVCRGADVERDTRVELAPGARCVLRETLVLGRSGESGGRVRQCTAAYLGGTPVLVEDLDLRDGLLDAPGVMGGHRVLDAVTALGFRPAPSHDERREGHGRLDLAAEGAIERFVGAHAHLSGLSATATAWAAEASAR